MTEDDPLGAFYECLECGVANQMRSLIAFPYGPEGRLHCPRCGATKLQPLVAEQPN